MTTISCQEWLVDVMSIISSQGWLVDVMTIISDIIVNVLFVQVGQTMLVPKFVMAEHEGELVREDVILQLQLYDF